MPRTKKAFLKIRDQSKRKIINASLKLFAVNGYHSTSIRQIAEAANISNGLLYNYFDGKEALLHEILNDATKKIMESFDPNNDGILTKEEFLYFIDQTICNIQINTSYWRLYSSLMLQPKIIDIVLYNFEKHNNSMNKMLLVFFQKQGSKNPKGEVFLFQTILKGAMIQFVSMPNKYPINYLKETLINHYKKSPFWT